MTKSAKLIYFFCIKCQAKNDFPKDVERRVDKALSFFFNQQVLIFSYISVEIYGIHIL